MRALPRRAGAVVAGLGLMVATAAMSMPPAEPAVPAEVPVFWPRFPKGSGNTRKSGNYWSRGRQVNSGNFSVANASPKSNNVYSGSNYANGPQCFIERNAVVKRRGC
ncbi:hypothetical protein [Nonomuraea sp. CA-141351]|uniref:hypothetical protein n=1 Tax=Nonomuraea sp. CA-141351 TaxID=3239996 RepID=UPI003D94E3D3